MILLYIVVGIAINQLIAYVVLDGADDEERTLFNWWNSGPELGRFLITQFWPVTLFFWLRKRKEESK
jgi:hypothetical protein